MFNLLSTYHAQDLHKITTIMHDKKTIEEKFNLKELKVKPEFSFDEEFRRKFQQTKESKDVDGISN